MELIDRRNATLRRLPDWAKVRAAHVPTAADIAPSATFVGLGRVKDSYRGIARHKSIKT